MSDVEIFAEKIKLISLEMKTKMVKIGFLSFVIVFFLLYVYIDLPGGMNPDDQFDIRAGLSAIGGATVAAVAVIFCLFWYILRIRAAIKNSNINSNS